MTAILKVDTIQDTSGNNIINESSDTITIGASGDTISIPSGATIANSGTATGFGKLLQVVTATSTTNTDTNSTTFVASQITANITPSATSSKIYVSVCSDLDSQANGHQAYTTIFRDGTNLAGGSSLSNFGNNFGLNSRVITPVSMCTLDSPSSTSQLTYAAYVRSGGSSVTVKFNNQNITGTIVLMEIAG